MPRQAIRFAIDHIPRPLFSSPRQSLGCTSALCPTTQALFSHRAQFPSTLVCAPSARRRGTASVPANAPR
jgi:hypothetical protein